MLGILRPAFIGMQNFEIAKVAGELARIQAEARQRLAGRGNVDNGEHDAFPNNAALGRLEEIALKVIAHEDEIPGIWIDRVLVFFEIGNSSINGRITCGENADGFARPVNCGHLPALIRQP